MQTNPDLLLLLGQLEGKLDAVLLQQKRVECALIDIERRVRHLETGWAKLLGAAAISALVVSYLFQLVTST